MRRILGLLLALALLSGCYSSFPTGQHWSYSTGSNAGSEQVIWVMTATDAAYPQLHEVLNWAAYTWSASSDRVEFRVAGGDWCSSYPWEDCIQVYLGTTRASFGYEAYWQGHLTGNNHIVQGSFIQFDFGVLYEDVHYWINIACHELAHGLGLAHGDIPGPCANGWPTQTDLDNVAQTYNPHHEVL